MQVADLHIPRKLFPSMPHCVKRLNLALQILHRFKDNFPWDKTHFSPLTRGLRRIASTMQKTSLFLPSFPICSEHQLQICKSVSYKCFATLAQKTRAHKERCLGYVGLCKTSRMRCDKQRCSGYLVLYVPRGTIYSLWKFVSIRCSSLTPDASYAGRVYPTLANIEREQSQEETTRGNNRDKIRAKNH